MTDSSTSYTRMRSDGMSSGFVCTGCALVGVVLALVSCASLRIVAPTTVGVASTFGYVSDAVLQPGVHVLNPFSSVTAFSSKTQLFEQANHVPTKEGLTVELDVAVLYHVDIDMVRSIFLMIGENYQNTVIEPEVASAVRGVPS